MAIFRMIPWIFPACRHWRGGFLYDGGDGKRAGRAPDDRDSVNLGVFSGKCRGFRLSDPGTCHLKKAMFASLEQFVDITYNSIRRNSDMTTSDQNTNQNTQADDLGTQGQKDRVQGKLDQVAGKVQKKVGQVTGNKETEAKGKAREMGGKVEDKVGKAEKKIDDTLKS